MKLRGTLSAVQEVVDSEALAVSSSAGAGSLTLATVALFDDEGGLGRILNTDTGTSEDFTYTTINEDTGELDIFGTLTDAYSLDTAQVFPLPERVTRLATVLVDELEDSAVIARVPYGLMDRLDVGTRSTDDAESVWIDEERVGEWIVVDVLEQLPPIVEEAEAATEPDASFWISPEAIYPDDAVYDVAGSDTANVLRQIKYANNQRQGATTLLEIPGDIDYESEVQFYLHFTTPSTGVVRWIVSWYEITQGAAIGSPATTTLTVDSSVITSAQNITALGAIVLPADLTTATGLAMRRYRFVVERSAAVAADTLNDDIRLNGIEGRYFRRAIPGTANVIYQYNTYNQYEGGQVFTYVHSQATPAASWTILHNLDGYPNVAVVDSAGDGVEGDVDYVDSNTMTITFAAAFSGTAYLS